MRFAPHAFVCGLWHRHLAWALATDAKINSIAEARKRKLLNMKKISLPELVRYMDHLLRLPAIKDFEGAVNGLQVENRGTVTRIAAAVDASATTIGMAAEAGADLLLVHHGLFWSVRQPWTGRNYKLLIRLLENNLALYSVHLPLDIHPKLGNNAQFAAALGFRKLQPFFPFREQPIGLKTRTRISREELVRRLRQVLGSAPYVIPAGPPVCRSIGIVTGGAGSELKLAAQEGVDTLITGEGPHWTFALAEELEMNVFYGGHYATETFGVKALASHLSKKFKLPWTFLDHPTGL